MYKQILLMYHLESRDKPMFEAMGSQIETYGLCEQVFIRNMEEVYRHPYDYSPDIVISPLPRNNRGTAMFTLLKVIYQCYWVGYTVETFYDTNEDNMWIIGNTKCPIELIDKYLFCGPGIAALGARLLLAANRTDSSDRIDYFGYLYYEKNVIERINKSFTDDSKIFQEYKKYKKHLLFVTAIMKYPMTLDDYLGEIAIKDSRAEAARELQKLCIANNYYSDKYIEAICYLAKRHPDYMIMVKHHPNDNDKDAYVADSRYLAFEKFSNIYTIPGNVQISNYFGITDVFLHYASTTSLEAYIYGIRSIGLTSNHQCMQKNGLGREAMYANSIIEVENFEDIDKEIEKDIKFERNADIEKVLYNLVNYKYGDEYAPSKRLIEILDSLDKPQKLDKQKRNIKKVLLYKSNRKKYFEYGLDALKSLVGGDYSKAKRIMKTFGRIISK